MDLAGENPPQKAFSFWLMDGHHLAVFGLGGQDGKSFLVGEAADMGSFGAIKGVLKAVSTFFVGTFRCGDLGTNTLVAAGVFIELAYPIRCETMAPFGSLGNYHSRITKIVFVPGVVLVVEAIGVAFSGESNHHVFHR